MRKGGKRLPRLKNYTSKDIPSIPHQDLPFTLCNISCSYCFLLILTALTALKRMLNSSLYHT